MITDDTATPGPHGWEVNIAATARQTDSQAAGELPLLDINYGVGERIQLKYEVPWVAQRDGAGESRSGLGNSLVGVKWRFFDEPGSWKASTYPQVELRVPGSDRMHHGVAESGTGVLLPLEFERQFGTLGVNFEAGRELNSSEPGVWFGGAVLGYHINERVELMSELHGESSVAPTHHALEMNLGARCSVGTLGTLLVSIGRDLHNGIDARASAFGYLGWQTVSGAAQ